MKESIIPHSRPTLSETDIQVVSQVLKSGNIVQGEHVGNFEKSLSTFIGHKGGVATNSGSSALHLALIALKISKGDEVALPSFVCTAPLNAIKYVGATPLLIDINPETMNMDFANLKRKINPETKAIILPHMFGLPADVDEIMEFEKPLIEDCAHSLGAKYVDERVGSFGILSIFSFYATKMISTGEGGMITSASLDLVENIKDLREYDKKEEWKVRYNYKMTDFQAAMGLSQISKLPEFVQKRRAIAKLYNQEFKDLPIEMPKEYDDRSHVFYRYIIKVDKNLLGIRKRLMDEGIICERPVYKPLHQYLDDRECLSAQRTWNRSLSIPIYPSLTDNEIERIISSVKRIFV